MKNIITILTLALTLSAGAQNFEGTITWKVNYTANDTISLRALRETVTKSYIWAFKDGNHRLSEIGGTESHDLLWLAKKQQYYSLDAKSRIYWRPTVGHWATAKASDKQVVTNTGEQRVIFGFHCTKYIVTPKGDIPGLPEIRWVYWVTTEIKGLDMRTMPFPGNGNGIIQFLFHQDISGMPMLIETPNPMFNMSIEVGSVSRKDVPPATFVIPTNFKEFK